jgi:hypothetical protein
LLWLRVYSLPRGRSQRVLPVGSGHNYCGFLTNKMKRVVIYND